MEKTTKHELIITGSLLLLLILVIIIWKKITPVMSGPATIVVTKSAPSTASVQPVQTVQPTGQTLANANQNLANANQNLANATLTSSYLNEAGNLVNTILDNTTNSSGDTSTDTTADDNALADS